MTDKTCRSLTNSVDRTFVPLVVYGYLYTIFTTLTAVVQNQYHFVQGAVGLAYLGLGQLWALKPGKIRSLRYVEEVIYEPVKRSGYILSYYHPHHEYQERYNQAVSEA